MELERTSIGTITPSLVRAVLLNHTGDVNKGTVECPCGDTYPINGHNDHLQSALRRSINVLVLPSSSITGTVHLGVSAMHRLLGTDEITEWTPDLFVGELSGWRVPSTFLKVMSGAYPYMSKSPEHERLYRGNTALALREHIFDHVGSALDFGPVENDVTWTCSCGETYPTDNSFEQHGFLKLQERGLTFGSAIELVAQSRTLTRVAKAIDANPARDRTLSEEFHHAADVLSMEIVMLHAPLRRN